MRVRITWHVVTRGRGEDKVPAEVLRQKAARLMEVLITQEEDGQLQNVAVETDADESSITAEAILSAGDDDVAASHLRSVGSMALDHPPHGSGPAQPGLDLKEIACEVEASE
ncbi:hypothetical protein [Micromonospora sp. HUAS LYJ1]|uniref:hypothetical protein n=1 Tax=Micromonospora sp. HUAS LYJ1 TaxID=3061626 RepID=UPI002671D8D0|nr:hypothetical protein [Micromonospora sp. HUAS LYJ1]WKU05634.1 hypothetical protein Q2K16_00775 [Micromonospora sp. HUAS LYJ1]